MRNVTCILMLAIAAAFMFSCAMAYDNDQPFVYNNGMRVNRRGFKSSLLSTARGFGKRSEMNGAEVLAEQVAHSPRVLAYLFRHLDEDQDGVITPDEIAGVN